MSESSGDFESFSWKKIGLWHLIGILVAPYIFGLVVLFRDGYSKRAKLTTGIYMALFLALFIFGRKPSDATSGVGDSTSVAEQVTGNDAKAPAQAKD